MASAKSSYLILYNGTFAALWLTLLVRILALGPLSSYEKTYDAVGDFAKWIQTAALLEVVHAALGQSFQSFHIKRAAQENFFVKVTLTHVLHRARASTSHPNLRPNGRQKPHLMDHCPPISNHRALTGLHHLTHRMEYWRGNPIWILHTHAFWKHPQIRRLVEIQRICLNLSYRYQR